MGNTRYYSAIAPNPARFGDIELPHITIQIPVFMESLTRYISVSQVQESYELIIRYSVILPTITSVKAAIRHYESVGGTASIFVNDDGMQNLDPIVAE